MEIGDINSNISWIESGELLTSIKDIFQILFFITGSILAILTYRQARKTLFQPAKNEVFKIQIIQLQELLGRINWKSAHEAMEETGLKESSSITIHNMFLTFAETQLQTKLKSTNTTPKIVGGIINKSSPMLDMFELLKGPADSSPREENKDVETREWSKFSWHMFEITERLDNTIKELEQASSNPLFPISIVEKLTALKREVMDTIHRIAAQQELVIRDFPRHYPNKESLKNSNLSWVNNEISERGEELFEKYLDLKEAVRLYLKSDHLFSK